MEKKNKIRLPAKASLFYGAGIVISKLIGVITTPLFTRAMSEVEYGLYSYYISILGIASMLSGIFLTPAVFYSGLGKFTDKKNGFIKSAIILSSGINLIFCIVLFTFSHIFGIKREFTVIMLFQGILDTVVTSELLKSKFSYGYGRVLAINLSSAIISTALSLFLVIHLGMGAMGRMLSLLLSAGIVVFVILIKGEFQGKSDKVERKFLVKNSLPLIPAVISRAAISSLDKLTVKAYLGVDALAKYSVAHTVGTALFPIIGALSSAINPWLVRKLRGGKRKEAFPIIGEISALIGWGSVIVITITPEIFSFLAPERYKEAIYVISPLALASVPYFIFTVTTVFLGFSEKTRIVSISAVLGASANLALCLTLISKIGYMGGGIAYFVAECTMALCSLALLRRWDKEASMALLGKLEVYITFAIGSLIPFLYGCRAARILILILPICQAIRHGFTCLELAKEK